MRGCSELELYDAIAARVERELRALHAAVAALHARPTHAVCGDPLAGRADHHEGMPTRAVEEEGQAVWDPLGEVQRVMGMAGSRRPSSWGGFAASAGLLTAQ
jgi:hypothetical protein